MRAGATVRTNVHNGQNCIIGPSVENVTPENATRAASGAAMQPDDFAAGRYPLMSSSPPARRRDARSRAEICSWASLRRLTGQAARAALKMSEASPIGIEVGTESQFKNPK
jgi:hypothetical protein